MRYDLLDESADKLKQSLTEAGFPDAEVSVRTERTTRPYSIDLALSIVEGRPVIIEKIIIDRPDEARAMMKTREGDLYDQFRLRDDLSALKKSYKSMEHVNPVIGPYTFSGGVLTINVDPGLRLRIAFEGNAAVSNKELLKEIPFFEAEDFRNDLVEEAVARITALYRSRGYPLGNPFLFATLNVQKVTFLGNHVWSEDLNHFKLIEVKIASQYLPMGNSPADKVRGNEAEFQRTTCNAPDG